MHKQRNTRAGLQRRSGHLRELLLSEGTGGNLLHNQVEDAGRRHVDPRVLALTSQTQAIVKQFWYTLWSHNNVEHTLAAVASVRGCGLPAERQLHQ